MTGSPEIACLTSGSAVNFSIPGAASSGANYAGVFTSSYNGDLNFEVPKIWTGRVGLTNVDIQIATLEPRSVIFCALLAAGICGVERRRLRETFLKNGKWKMRLHDWGGRKAPRPKEGRARSSGRFDFKAFSIKACPSECAGG